MAESSKGPKEQYSFDATADTEVVRAAIESGQEVELGEVAVGGRLLGLRNQGKIVFGTLHDQSGAIQVVADQEQTPEFEKFGKHNIGDWVGVKGAPGKTQRGEPSIFIKDWVTLAQTELPFPSSRHGLRNVETVARQRYIDLAVNPISRQRFLDRSTIISQIRQNLDGQDFVEVETPILQPLYGGASARPFETHHNALDMDLFLRIAPELYLKRLVVGGLTRVFEIGKVFRNEGMSPKHNPEFTMMEVYAAYWDHESQMQLTENLVAEVAQKVRGSQVISYQDREVNLTPPWRRATMDELVSTELGEDLSIDTNVDRLRGLAQENGVDIQEGYGPGKLLLELYEKTVESTLWGPIFVTEYPKEVSPLARSHRMRPGYTERFEGIVAGNELCNGFSELNDPEEQYYRFRDQEATSEHDDEAMRMDYDYIRALKYGLPPTAGLGIGIDRLVMLITDTPSIRDVILFPTLKPDGYKTAY